MSQLAGTAHILIRPDFSGFHSSVAAEVARVPRVLTVRVLADTAPAVSQIGRLSRDVTRLGARRVAVTVTANTASAVAGIFRVKAALAALGAAGAPALLGIGAGIAGLAGPLTAAAAGFGALAAVAVPALGRVKEALDAQKQGAEEAAAALAKLTPLERQVFVAWQELRSEFTTWGKQLQPHVLPAFVSGIELLRAALPLATPLVRAAGTAIGGLVEQAAAAAHSPFWRQFSSFLGQAAGPAITQLGQLFGSAITGAAGLIQALAPIGTVFLAVLSQVAARWESFATGLVDSPGWRAFVEQFTALAPTLVQAFSAVGSLVGAVFAALAPAVAPAVGLLRVLAVTLAGLVQQIGPALQQVLGVLGPALGQVISALGPALGAVAVALAPVLVQLVQGLAPILSALAPILGRLLAALAPVVSALIAGLQPIIAALVPVVGVLATAIGSILGALAPLLPVLGEFIAGLVSGLLPILTPIVQMIALVAGQLAGVLIDALKQTLPPLGQIVLAVASLLPAVLPLLPVIVQLVTAFAPLLPLVAQLALLLVQVLVPVVRIVLEFSTKLNVLFGTLLAAAIRLVAKAMQWFFVTVAQPVLTKLAQLTQWAYTKAKPLLDNFGLTWKQLGGTFQTVYRTVVQPVLRALGVYLRTVVAPAVTWLYQSIVRPIWRALGAHISTIWTTVIRPAFNALKAAIGSMGRAFDTGVTAIRTAWSKIRKATRDPINFVIGTIYNKGVAGTWNKVMGWLHLPDSLRLGKLPMLARGGTLTDPAPARPMKTRGPMAIVGEGRKQYPEYVIPTDPAFRGRAQALWASAGGDLQMLAKGGILGGVFDGVLDTVKGTAGKIFNLGASAVELMTNPKKVWERLTDPLYDQARTVATSPFGHAAAALPTNILDQAWKAAQKIITTFSQAFGGGANRVVQVAKSLIGTGDRGGVDNNRNQYNGYNGEPWCADFVSWVVDKAGATRAYWNSPTGTPAHRWPAVAQWRAAAGRVLPTSQARPGDLAVYGNRHINIVAANLGGGRLSTIGGNEGPRVRASVRGDADGVLRPGFSVAPGAGVGLGGAPGPLGGGVWLGGDTPPRWYDQGGWLEPGLTLVANATGKPEPVLNRAQWDALTGAAARGAGEEIHYHAHFDGMTAASYEAHVRTALQAEMVLAGQRDRTGRRR